MPFTVTTREVAGPAAGTVYALGSDAARIEVWPQAGFNCLRWQVRTGPAAWGDLLDVAPDWDANPVPTRSGHPVLFPFPNRLRAGRFEFAGRTYQLPLTESTKTHAIHGFTPRHPWRVVGAAASDDSASVTAEFQLSVDVPGGRDVWPADFILTLTYTVSAATLAVRAVVANPDVVPLPFGLGYHGYFKPPTAAGAAADGFTLSAATGPLWLAESGLATGEVVPPPADADFRTPRPVGPQVLDHLYRRSAAPAEMATLSRPARPGVLTVAADPAFREVLLFTPPHRRAVAVEPYTCASDAANLTARGADAGWRVLPPGETWAAAVRYDWRAGG